MAFGSSPSAGPAADFPRDSTGVPASVTLTEVGLTLIFVSWTLTRTFQRRALRQYGFIRAVQLAACSGGVVPVWVSLCNVLGWALALVAGTWVTFHIGE